MVCPLRVFIGVGSFLLLAGVICFMVLEGREWEDLPLWMRPSGDTPRTWRQFVWAMFTGELIMAWWRGGPAEARSERGECVFTREKYVKKSL